MRHAVKQTVTVCWRTNNSELLSRDVVPNVVKITCFQCRPRIFRFTDTTLSTLGPGAAALLSDDGAGLTLQRYVCQAAV